MIEKMLEYQEKDKQRLALLATVENGRVKHEIDVASRALDDAKQSLLALENDAKTLSNAYEGVKKTLGELFDRIEQFKKPASQNKSEEEITSATAYVSAMLQKTTVHENQLEDLAKRIAAKTVAFKYKTATVARAQNIVRTLTPQYEQQKKQIEPKIAACEKEMAKIGAGINKELLDKYKRRRASDKSEKIADIVVKIAGERCGACFHEMPTLLVHKIKTDGYIVCENCGKIIY